MKKSQRRSAATWLRPLAAASLMMAVVIAILLALRTRNATSASAPPDAGISPELGTEPTAALPRHGLPANAWAILDVELVRFPTLAAQVPRALQTLDCRQVSPPERVAVALLAPTRAAPQDDSLEFLVAATETTPEFRTCARQRMQQVDGLSKKWPGNVEVLHREGGGEGGLRLLVQKQRDLLVFASAPSLETEQLVEILVGTRPSAVDDGHHSALLRSLPRPEGLALTVVLPDRWLENLVEPEEARRSPLHFLRATAWALHEDDLRGVVDCKATDDGAGCEVLARFLEGTRNDLLGALAPEDQQLLDNDWTLKQTGPTRLEIRWHLPASARSHLLHLLTSRF